jgi:hypothetical protein
MTYYVYSTLTCDNFYVAYSTPVDKNQLPHVLKKILIKGGNAVAQKNLHTPHGVVTEVEDSDMKISQKDHNFKMHESNGFIRVEKKEAPVKKVVKDMAEKDGSAPKTPKDFQKKPKADDDDSDV